MPISYGLIARGPVVLCEAFVQPGTFTVIARKILHKVPSRTAEKKSYGYEGQVFHHISDELGLITMCMADEGMTHRICFAFLQDVRKRFLGSYENAFYNAGELAFNDRFARTLLDRMNFYSYDPEADKVRKVQAELDGVKTQMKDNIDKVLERSDRIESLVEKTDTLQTHGSNFKRVSTKLRRNLWWKNMKTWILLFCTIGAVVFVVTLVILGALHVIP